MVAEACYPDPKYLYDPDPKFVTPMHKEYGAEVGGVITGIALHMSTNYWRRRPFRAGFYMYPLYAAFFGATFHYLRKLAQKYYSRRDTMYKHYIMLHPEDFPPPPKVKIGELLEDWIPVR